MLFDKEVHVLTLSAEFDGLWCKINRPVFWFDILGNVLIQGYGPALKSELPEELLPAGGPHFWL